MKGIIGVVLRGLGIGGDAMANEGYRTVPGVGPENDTRWLKKLSESERYYWDAKSQSEQEQFRARFKREDYLSALKAEYREEFFKNLKATLRESHRADLRRRADEARRRLAAWKQSYSENDEGA